MQETYTARLAEFACSNTYETLPPSVTKATKRLLKDTLGCAVAGFDLPSSEIVSKVIQAYGGAEEATVLVSGKKMPAPLATYINSHLVNAIDADDTYKYKAHLAAATLPAAIAMAERQNSSGKELIAAIAVGFEVAGRIGMSLKGLMVTPEGEQKFAPVSGYSWGAFGAVVCAGRLLGLNYEQMLNAINITASTIPVAASGKFGETLPRPMTKYAMYGTLGEAGIVAALLAKEGFTGEPAMLDGDNGLWRMLGSLGVDWDRLTEGLGENWGVELVAYKPYPGCRFAGAAIDMLLKIKEKQGLGAEEIERIEVAAPGVALVKKLDSPVVESMVDACFSIPFLLGCALHGGVPGPGWHTPAARANPAIRAFMDRVVVDVEPTAGQVAAEDLKRLGHIARMRCAIKVHARGQVFSASSDYAHGDPYIPESVMTDAEMDMKFSNFCATELTSAQISTAIGILDNLEAERDLTALLAQLVRQE
ncbi:MmgE/PrpD family protein [Noviherbaspirillum sedimenti]|nr:MmgE/PrpD family protein [Noviherbaspirillum sedimenti]